MTEQGFVALAHGSSDLVLAAHFNFYGTRLVTGSADHRIRVFDLDERAGWQIVDAWRGHNGEVLDVRWFSEVRCLCAPAEMFARSNGMAVSRAKYLAVSAKI